MEIPGIFRSWGKPPTGAANEVWSPKTNRKKTPSKIWDFESKFEIWIFWWIWSCNRNTDFEWFPHFFLFIVVGRCFFLKMHFISVKEARCRPLAFPLCQACGMASAVGVRAPDGPSNAMGDFSWRWVSLKSKSLECHRLQRKMLLGWSDEKNDYMLSCNSCFDFMKHETWTISSNEAEWCLISSQTEVQLTRRSWAMMCQTPAGSLRNKHPPLRRLDVPMGIWSCHDTRELQPHLFWVKLRVQKLCLHTCICNSKWR